MPAGLALLPNQRYRDAQGDAGWLRPVAASGGAVGAALPQFGDPYAEIYRNREHAWRLIDANLLRPGKIAPEAAYAGYLRRLAGAEKFHQQLSDSHHPRTTHIICDGLKTAERHDVRIHHVAGDARAAVAGAKSQPVDLYDADLSHMQMGYDTRDFSAFKLAPWSLREALNVQLPGPHGAISARRAAAAGIAVKLNLQPFLSIDGDGTVPVASALAADPAPHTVRTVHNVAHADAMKNGEVQRQVWLALRALGHGLIAREAQRLGGS